MSIFSSDRLPLQDVVSALGRAGFDVSRFRKVERTLLDTFDGRLHGAGIRLEIRRNGGLQLIVSDGGPAPAAVAVDRVPIVARDLPHGPVRARLASVVDIRALQPLITVTSLYASALRRNGSGKVIVGVELHAEPALGSGERLAIPWSAQVVPYEGYAKAAQQALDLLDSIGLECQKGDTFECAARGAGVDLRGFRDAPSVGLEPCEPAGEGFRRVLANLARTIEANRQGTIDDVDPEFLHDLRIAVRRTRSILSHGKGALPSEGRDHFRGEFRWLGDVTSPLRDMDVYLIEWPGYVQPLGPDATAALAPVVDHIERRRAAEHAALADHLSSARYQGLMGAWQAWLAAPVEDGAVPKRARRPLGPVVAARIIEAQGQLLARGRTINPTTPAEELHELRKDAKRLRYLLECFGGLLPGSARKPFVQRLKALQDNLGEHQDTEVHTAELKRMSVELHGAPGVTAETLVAMGRLTELFEQRRQHARDDFTERFATYDTKPTARALDALLEAAQER